MTSQIDAPRTEAGKRRKRHEESQGPWPEAGHVCLECWQRWPCDFVRLYEAIEAEAAAPQPRDDLRAKAAPGMSRPVRRDPAVDWDAVEGLVYDAQKRGEITEARARQMLGLRYEQTWRDRCAEMEAAK